MLLQSADLGRYQNLVGMAERNTGSMGKVNSLLCPGRT
jgi:hypothetical protein